MKTRITFVSLILLVATAQGQSVVTPSTAPAPTFLGNYSVTLQQFVPAPPPGAPLLVYDNAVFNGSFFASGPGVANMDWGTLSANNHNFMKTMQIGYATTEPDPFQSGVVDIVVSLHEAATGFGDDGTTISSFLLSGLPGSQSGGAEAFVFDVTLPGPVHLPDGPIGYSYEPTDTTTGPLLSGPGYEVGVVDAFDRYAGTGGPYTDTVNFGGAPAPLATFWCQLTGDESECFLVIGDDDDPAAFTPLGHTFSTQVGTIEEYFDVLLDDIPQFKLPAGRSMFGVGAAMGGSGQTVSPDWMADGRFTVQVVMWNPYVFPGQPEQYSSGLRVRLMPDGTVKTRPFGASVGMDIWADVGVDAQGNKVISFPFSIDDL